MERGSKALAHRFLQHLGILSRCHRDTISQLCPNLPSHLPAESILSYVQDQHSFQLSLIWTCSKRTTSCRRRAPTPGSAPPGAHKAYPILPCRSSFFPLLPPPTDHTPFSISPTPFFSPFSFSWKSKGTRDAEASRPASSQGADAALNMVSSMALT